MTSTRPYDSDPPPGINHDKTAQKHPEPPGRTTHPQVRLTLAKGEAGRLLAEEEERKRKALLDRIKDLEGQLLEWKQVPQKRS